MVRENIDAHAYDNISIFFPPRKNALKYVCI